MKTNVRAFTLPQVKAQASALDGTPSRAALVLAEDPPADPRANPDQTVGELWLYGVVGGWWRGFDAESVASALAKMGKVDVLYVRIHSPGGYAEDGIAIGNLLRNYAAKVVVVIDGIAASAASVIAIAGDEIIMCPGSRFMLHDASAYGWGTASALAATSKSIDDCSRNYAGVYALRAGGTPEQWREVMLANNELGTWYTADEGVAAGLADSVGTVIAVGSPTVAPADDLDDEDILARAAHDLQILEQCVHPAVRAAWRSEPPKPPTAHTRPVQSPPPEGGPAVAFSFEQLTTMRTKLELPADADEAAITAALVTVVDESLEERPTTTASVPTGMKLVSATVFDDVTAKAEAGAKAAEELLTMRCDATLDRYRDRFPSTPEARTKWAADYRRDPAGTEAYLAASTVIAPTTEAGHAGDGENQPVAVTADPTYKNWKW